VAFKVLKQHVFSKTTDGPLQQGLTNFIQRVETQINSVTLDFGIAFILIALCIFTVLIIRHKRLPHLSYASADPETQSRALANSSAPEKQTPTSNTPPTQPGVPPVQIPKAKRPRLIQ
jgi:hypothetical protein